MELEQIIRETKIVRPDLAIEILSKHEHPNGLSVELVRKLLFGYKEGLQGQNVTIQSLRSAITYAEHALSQIPEEPERNKGITRGQIRYYLGLFYEKATVKGGENISTAYEHISKSVEDGITYRDWSAIDERTRMRNRLIDKLKPTDTTVWLLRGANDNSNTARELDKNKFPHKNIISGLYFRAAKLYREASHEFEDKKDSTNILIIGYDCAKKSLENSEQKFKNTKMFVTAEFAYAAFLNTREKKYRQDAINFYEELSKDINREIAFQSKKKLKEINGKS